MELVALVCLCLVTRCGITAAGVNGPKVVEEGSDVILPCSLSTKENIQAKVFDWKKDGPRDREVFLYDAGSHYNNGRPGQSETFKGRVSHFPDQLKNGIASITIRNTKVADSGNYTCHFPRLQPPQTFYVELIVVGAAKPSVTTLGPKGDGLLLQCEVRGASPEPRVQWRDSDGNNLTAEEPQVSERGGSYDVILQVTVTKTDYYRCVATQETIGHQIYTETYVSVNGPKVVEERSDVILPCSLSTKENIQAKLFDWKKDGPKVEREVFLYDAGIHYNNGRPGQSQTFKGRVSHFPDQLKNGIASITIRNTKVADSGHYTCDFPRLQPPQTFYVELIVVGRVLKDRTGENIPGAAPKPSVTQLEQTKDWSRLQCEVRDASPEPRLQWQDSDGNNLTAEEPQVSERGGSYNVILQVTVTKTNRYRCVATQETIGHQISNKIYVYIRDGVLKDRTGENTGAAEPYVTTLGPTEDGLLLQCRVKGASPKPHLQWQDSAGNNLTAEEPQVLERGGSYDVILQVTVTKTDRYRCVATQETISHQIYTETYVSVNEFPTGWIVAVAVLVNVLVLVVVGAVLVYKFVYIPLKLNKYEEKRRDSLDANSGASLPLKSTTTTSQQHADNRREEVSFNDD